MVAGGEGGGTILRRSSIQSPVPSFGTKIPDPRLDLYNLESGGCMCVIIHFTLFTDCDTLHPLVL